MTPTGLPPLGEAEAETLRGLLAIFAEPPAVTVYGLNEALRVGGGKLEICALLPGEPACGGEGPGYALFESVRVPGDRDQPDLSDAAEVAASPHFLHVASKAAERWANLMVGWILDREADEAWAAEPAAAGEPECRS